MNRTRIALRSRRTRAGKRLNKAAITMTAVVALILVGTIFANRGSNPFRRGAGNGALQGGSLAPGSPNIEYVFAGGRMVASEQPVVVTLTAPTGVIATANTATSITITWTAPSSGTVTGYNVLRQKRLNDPNAVTVSTGSTATSFTDSPSTDPTFTSNFTYLYQVQAVGGPFSTLTNVSFATAYSLAISGSVQSGLPIKATQINSIRTAINMVVSAAQGTPMGTISSGARVQATDVSQMQTVLSNAYGGLGLGAPSFNRTISSGLAVLAADYLSVASATRAAP